MDMFKKKLVAGALLIILSLAYFTASQSALSKEDLTRQLANNTVKMYTAEGRGIASGSIVRLTNNKLVVLTNAHVCRATDDGFIYFTVNGMSGVTFRVETIKRGIDIDLCAAYLPKLLISSFTGVTLAKEVRTYEEVLLLGHPKARNLTPSFGQILERTIIPVLDFPGKLGCLGNSITFGQYCLVFEDLLQTNLYTFPGNSGSIVVNFEGELVGVLNSGSDDTRYGNIVPLDLVRGFLRGLE